MGRDVLPVPLRTTSDNLDQMITTQGRFKVSNSPRQEQLMVTGEYFTASLARENRPVEGVPSYVVIDTGDKYHVLEELTIDIDYQNIGDGNVNIKTAFYAIDSNRSDITITGGTPVQLGVPLNMDFVNEVSQAFFRFDATVTINSGDPDFIVFASQYYKDTSGNKETIGGLQAGFFEKGRKIIMSPNKTYVFETIASGVVTGTFDSLTQFSFTEQSTESDE